MKSNKSGLDEMQRAKSDRIGHQMFMLMYAAILINCGLYGWGGTWLPYPVDMVLIISVCVAIYLIRVIKAGAYLPPKAQNRKNGAMLVITVLFSVLISIGAAKYGLSIFAEARGESGDGSALPLMVASAVGLIIMLVLALIRRANDKKETEE